MATLENILVFIRCVENGSFSSAGRSLGLSAAVISHRIKMLEQHLGCRLFHRTTRQMRLTEQGGIFHERCVEIREPGGPEVLDPGLLQVGQVPAVVDDSHGVGLGEPDPDAVAEREIHVSKVAKRRQKYSYFWAGSLYIAHSMA